MGKLSGKTAVITGGNSGIGFSAAQLFLKEGAKVIITGRDQKAIDEALKNLGEGAYGLLSDAGKMKDLEALPEKITAISNKIDVLFANAGVGMFAPFEETSEAIFDANMDINFKGAFFTVQKLLPLMPNEGSILLNATVLVHKGLATASSYAASKGAVLAFTKTLAVELADRNIRVNCISPGPINTPIYSKMGMPETALQEFAAGVQAKIPLQRFGEAHEVAQTALFLASSESSFITGTEIIIDGGIGVNF